MDPSLIEQAQHGDRQAFSQLLEEISPLIHRFGLRMCRHRADADDVLQDTLLSVAEHLHEYEGRASLASWVFTLARTACARRRRGLKNRAHLPEQAAPERASDDGSPEDAVGQSELRTLLERALRSLSDEQREVLFLRDMEGLSAAEVAASLDLNVVAVKSRLHRARARLREAWEAAAKTSASPKSKDCPNVVLALSKKLEGDLVAEDCAAMEKHLETCPSCNETCATLRVALGACRSQEKGEISADLRVRIQELVRSLVAAR